MIPPVTIQRGNLPPLAHSVGCLVLCRYNGKDILCVRTYLKFIELEDPAQYFGTLQSQMKTSKFEITKEIVAVDGKMASFAIKCKGRYGLKKYLRSIAPHEGALCNESDAYIVTERGESIRAFPVKFKPLKGKNRFGVYLERGMMEDLPKGCPIYNKENKVIGMIKCKNYGILWFVSWFHESKLFKKCEIACIEECSAKDDESQQYQSIGNLSEQLRKARNRYSSHDATNPHSAASESPNDTADSESTSMSSIIYGDELYEEEIIESDTIRDGGTGEIVNYAEPFGLESGRKVRKVRKAEGPALDVISDLKHQVESMKRKLDILSKELEKAQMSAGVVDTICDERVEQQGYAALYDTPSYARKQSNERMQKLESDHQHAKDTGANVGTNVTNSFSYENIRIDGRLAKSPLIAKKLYEKDVTVLSVPNDYVRPDGLHKSIGKSPESSHEGPVQKQLWDNFSTVATINEIDQETLFELANELDDKDWERFACEIGVTEEVIKQIKLYQIGRTYAAVEFMTNFMTRFPREKLVDFRQNVLAIQRNDVVEYMDTKLNGQMMSTFQEIPHQQIEELASKLEMSQFKSIKYWRHLAGLYGYENQSINAMESTFGRHERSPTLALFDYMGKSTPHLSVLDIGKTLEKLGLIRMSKKLHGILSRRMICMSLPNLLECEFSTI